MSRFSEMETIWDWENIVSFGSKPASPSPEGSSAGSAEPLMGLKLGKRTYFENTPMLTPSCTALKKNRPNASVCCQVEGCNDDLSSAKDYHRKHRVCNRHSKFPMVIIGGQERRFCQQCSRFHSLCEFDEKKRSCRRRLSDHNARRRKPQPEALHFNSTRRLCSPFYGAPGNPLWDTLAQGYPLKSSTDGGQLYAPRSRFPHEINVQNRGDGFLAKKYSMSEVFNFNPGSKRSLASPSSLEVADRALSLLSNNPWGSCEPELAPSHNLMHQSDSNSNIAHSMIHANAEGVPLSSAEFWLSGQHSMHPNINSLAASASSNFQEFQLFKAPYETDFYSSILN